MTKYRKKPVVIEAVQWTGVNATEIVQFMGDDFATGGSAERSKEGLLTIATLEGEMVASPGDWIICGVKGEFYPCKPDIFAETYELVEGQA